MMENCNWVKIKAIEKLHFLHMGKPICYAMRGKELEIQYERDSPPVSACCKICMAQAVHFNDFCGTCASALDLNDE